MTLTESLKSSVLLLFFLVVFLTLSPSCGSSKKQATLPEMSTAYKAIAEKRYVGEVNYLFNESNTFVICQTRYKTNQADISPLDFFVFDLENEKIAFEESEVKGEVHWLNDHRIKVSLIPGIVTGDEQADRKLFGYIYDLNLRKKIYPERGQERDQ